jgi:hypothetical protein
VSDEQTWDVNIPTSKDAEIERLYDTIARLTGRAEAAEQREGHVLYLLCNYGQTDGAHHKAWLIDQIARTLLGDQYGAWIASMTADGLIWDTGIVP